MESAVLEERAPSLDGNPVSPASVVGRPAWPGLLLLGLTTFWGAALLFLMEPMVAKMLLPSLGGSAAVWNTAMVFFQAALLLGYGLTHAASRLRLRRHRALQVVLLSLVVVSLPIALPPWHPPTNGSPVVWVLAALAVAVGLPFVVLATTGPTLQSWLARSDHPGASRPYVLYAMSNAGSLLALLAYPLVVEPRYGLATQARLWSLGYGGFAVLFGICALVIRGHRVVAARQAAPDATRVTSRQRLRWVWMAFVPSALLLGVTRHISTDVAAIPLVWIVPLALYLLSFVVAFGHHPDRLVTVSSRAIKLLVIPVALTFASAQRSIAITIGLDLAVFALAALLCHARLSQERPAPQRLTSFYLCLSVGGVLGGVAAGLLAPLVFRSILEFPIALVCAIALRPREDGGARRRRPVALAAFAAVLTGGGVALAHSQTAPRDLPLAIALLGGAAVVAYVASRGPLVFAAGVAVIVAVATQVHPEPVLAQSRTFFGVHRVQRGVHGEHLLVDGTTTHGIEYLAGPKAGRPEGYYARTEPIGQYLSEAAGAGPRRVGVIGLGSGALAAYGRVGDAFTYYEIDPAIVRVAEDTRLFTFLRDTNASVRTVVGDGRLTLGADTAARYDTLVIDAFSSDAIPTHLLTSEAMDLYRRRLSPGGVIAFHISNRHFDLAPVLQEVAEHDGLAARMQTGPGTPADPDALSSTWVLLAADAGFLPSGPQWQPLQNLRHIRLWTDQYSNPVSVLRW